MKVIAAIGTAAAMYRESTDLALDAQRIPEDWKMTNAELDQMIEKKAEPAKPKSVDDLNFSEMLSASNNQQRLESITALQMEADMGMPLPKGVELSDDEFNETLPSSILHKRNHNNISEMNFSELINASNNQEKLYEMNNVGLDSEISRIPDSWQLSDEDYNKINARIERGPAHQFPKDVDSMSFTEQLTAAANMDNENQDKLYEAVKQDEFLQTSFISQDERLSVQDEATIVQPIILPQREGPKRVEDYSFSEAIEATNPAENVQLGWMDDRNFLTEKETNKIVGQYLPQEVRKNANGLRKEIHSNIDMDDASFSESIDALKQMNATE